MDITRQDFHRIILARLGLDKASDHTNINVESYNAIQELTISLNLDVDTITVDSLNRRDNGGEQYTRDHSKLSLQECKTLFNVKEYELDLILETELEPELQLGPQNEQISI